MKEQHTHTDECWEPDSGCDMGRNEKYVRSSNLDLTAADFLTWLQRKYVQRASPRQKEMGLVYMEAETHDLAKALASFVMSSYPQRWVDEAKGTLDKLYAFLQAKNVPHAVDTREWIENALRVLPAYSPHETPAEPITSAWVDFTIKRVHELVNGEYAKGWRDCVAAYNKAGELIFSGEKIPPEWESELWPQVPLPPTANECWEAVNALIDTGHLSGNGTDLTAQRNGIILAANAIAALMRNRGALKTSDHPDEWVDESDMVHQWLCGKNPARVGGIAMQTVHCTCGADNIYLQPVGNTQKAPAPPSDTVRLDWLQEELVDTIYLDDGRIIDVGGRYGGNLRNAIDFRREENGGAE